MNLKIICFFLLIILLGCKQNNPNTLLLKQLDETIGKRSVYDKQKEKKIDSIKSILSVTNSLEEKYNLNKELYNEYKFYQGDSALVYIYKNQKLAEKTKNSKYLDETKIQLSLIFSTSGIMRESLENLTDISRSTLDSSLLTDYYIANEWVNRISAEFINDTIFSPKYKALERVYKDSVGISLPLNSTEQKWYQASLLLEQGEYERAKQILLALSSKVNKISRRYAIINYDLATIYNKEENKELYEKHLILSAIADIKCSTKENVSLRKLASYLFEHDPDELERANLYIKTSLEDARFYNNRQRIVQIAEKLPLIADAYQSNSDKENRILKYLLLTISILSVFSILTSIYIYKQMKLIRSGRKELYKLNKKLESANHQLHNANTTLEEHVGLFMDLCSSYINKLEQYKDTVRRKILSNQIKDLYKMKDSPQLIKSELKDFFTNFDKSVLNLFPDFVNNFNNLLTEKGKIHPKKGELLTTELRIFALIRLGINDSSKIATFLHYSPQTIYNYRTKVKKEAIGNKEDFEKEIMNITS